jgi:hypothetical protein
MAASISPFSPAQSIEELDASIVHLSQRLNSETYRLLVLIREFDDRFGWAKWSFPNCAEWLAWRCGLSLSAAREKLRTAHALRGLPAISDAFSKGRLSYSKARALTRVANAQDEDLLLAYALNATAIQVEERCRQIRNVKPESTDIARRAFERRSLTIARNPAAGTVIITLEVPAEDGELVSKAIDRAIHSGEGDLGPEFKSSGWRAQQADAWIAIAKRYLSGVTNQADATGGRVSAADHYQVVVHVDDAALRGGVSHQSSAARADLPIETIKRLTCDGSIIRVTEDETGKPLDIGRKQRTVSSAIKRALWSRDRGCSFPGCERKRFVDAHHIRHWAEGGETSLENLILLCTQHHRLLHEGQFAIRHNGNSMYFERRDGRAIPKCGYRFEDSMDDSSDEVREPQGRYDIETLSNKIGALPSGSYFAFSAAYASPLKRRSNSSLSRNVDEYSILMPPSSKHLSSISLV